jgi:hypothetical protein
MHVEHASQIKKLAVNLNIRGNQSHLFRVTANLGVVGWLDRLLHLVMKEG